MMPSNQITPISRANIGKLLILALLSLISVYPKSIHSQSLIDSLKKEVKLAQGNDSIQTERLLDLSFEYFYTPNEGKIKACAELDKIFKLSNGENYGQLLVANNLYGVIKNKQEHFDEAIQYYEKAIELGTKELVSATPKRQLRLNQIIPQINDNIANIYERKGEVEKAIEIRLNVADQLEKLGDTSGLIITISNIGGTYIMNKNYRQAVNYLNKARLISEENNLSNSLSNIYGNLGISYANLNQKDSAIFYYLKCREVSNKKEDREVYLENEANIAIHYLSIGKYEKSNQAFEQLFNDFQDTLNPDLFYLKLLAAESYLKQGNHKEAEKLFSEVEGKLSIERPIVKKKYGEVGYKIKVKQENYKSALAFNNLYRNAKDSLYNLKIDSTFKVIESRYNVAKKQEIIDKQNLKLKTQVLYLIGLIAALFILGLLFYSYRNKKQYQSQLAKEQQKAKEIEISNLKRENKIISMQSMLEGQEEERKRIAQDLHDSIGTLMTSIKLKFLSVQKEIEAIQQMNITDELDEMISNASQQVRRISHQMTPRVLEIAGLEGAVNELETQLTSQGIVVEFDNKELEQIKSPSYKINLYRAIQEMINNIAKHAQATKVTMRSSIEHDHLHIILKDNGVGMDEKSWQNEKSTGINSIKSRIEYLEGTIALRVENGTEYQIKLPIK